MIQEPYQRRQQPGRGNKFNDPESESKGDAEVATDDVGIGDDYRDAANFFVTLQHLFEDGNREGLRQLKESIDGAITSEQIAAETQQRFSTPKAAGRNTAIQQDDEARIAGELRRSLISLTPTLLLRVSMLVVVDALTDPEVVEVPIGAELASQLLLQCASSAGSAADATLRPASAETSPNSQHWQYASVEPQSPLAVIDELVTTTTALAQYSRASSLGPNSLLVMRVRDADGMDLGRFYQDSSIEGALQRRKIWALWSGEQFARLDEKALATDKGLRLIVVGGQGAARTVVMQAPATFRSIIDLNHALRFYQALVSSVPEAPTPLLDNRVVTQGEEQQQRGSKIPDYLNVFSESELIDSVNLGGRFSSQTLQDATSAQAAVATPASSTDWLTDRTGRLVDWLGPEAAQRFLGLRDAGLRSGIANIAPAAVRHLLDVDYVSSRARLAFGGTVSKMWLCSPSRYLDGAIPLEVVRERGVFEVIDALDAAMAGDYY